MPPVSGETDHAPHGDAVNQAAAGGSDADPSASARPRAWNWFLFYCILMSLVCLFLVGSAIAEISSDGSGPASMPFTDPDARPQRTPDQIAAQRQFAIRAFAASGVALLAFAAALGQYWYRGWRDDGRNRNTARIGNWAGR